MQKTILYIWTLIMGLVSLAACEHDIDFDYPVAESVIVFDGRISNEDLFVKISHTRPMSDSTKNHFISDAQVWIISDDGSEEQLVYDEQGKCYISPTGLVGTPGHTYQMKATVEGRDYRATATMQPPSQIDTTYFRWVELLGERIFFVCIKGFDAYPEDRMKNYYLCRLIRDNEVFRWNPRSGRSSVNGIYEYDIICSSEKEIDEGIVENGRQPMANGDTIIVELMSIDRYCWAYFQSLVYIQSTNANPITNIEGGAQGIFMAANISRGDTLVFNKKEVLSHRAKE